MTKLLFSSSFFESEDFSIPPSFPIPAIGDIVVLNQEEFEEELEWKVEDRRFDFSEVGNFSVWFWVKPVFMGKDLGEDETEKKMERAGTLEQEGILDENYEGI